MNSIARVFVTFLATLPALAISAGLSPWQFGMSKADVAGFQDEGPYKSFSNGDLETFNGTFDGQKVNVQFFFDPTGLRRIGVYMYEGRDIKEAMIAWRRAYESLKHAYGDVEIPSIKVGPSSELPTPEVLATAAGANTEVTGKTQMAPIKQPIEMFVFSSFVRQDVQNVPFYAVVIYLDRHR